MIFFTIGLFAQMIIGAFILIIFFVAKLPKRILKHYEINCKCLFIVLLVINWMTYKDPAAIYNLPQQAKVILGPINAINGPIAYNYSLPLNSTASAHQNLVSQLWGGEIKVILTQAIKKFN